MKTTTNNPLRGAIKDRARHLNQEISSGRITRSQAELTLQKEFGGSLDLNRRRLYPSNLGLTTPLPPLGSENGHPSKEPLWNHYPKKEKEEQLCFCPYCGKNLENFL